MLDQVEYEEGLLRTFCVSEGEKKACRVCERRIEAEVHFRRAFLKPSVRGERAFKHGDLVGGDRDVANGRCHARSTCDLKMKESRAGGTPDGLHGEVLLETLCVLRGDAFPLDTGIAGGQHGNAQKCETDNAW